MNDKTLISELRAAFPALPLRENEPLARHCSFRIGGPAALLVQPASADELAAVCRFLKARGEKPLLLGNGTNMLFPDEGLDRIVVKTCPNVGGIQTDGTTITAECGATLSRVAVAALNAGLTGLEFAHGIPGSVGGGVAMNAGAYSGELRDVVTRTEYLDADMNVRTLTGAEHDFSYRHSFLTDHEGIVLRTAFTLSPGDPAAIMARMQELADKRRASQPLDMPSAGSTFKRPAGGFAAALIDEAGLKGVAMGGAQVSAKHAGFVVNTGGATCADVLRLMEHIQNTVLERTGIRLEPEVRIIRG
ncbi:MAG: UDP-N-acetylmuramate dehydrogenase [Oscillospiraceae bacterium]